MKQLSRKKIQDMIDLNGANISSRRSSGGSGAGGGGGVSSAWVDEHYVSKDFFARLFTINGTTTEGGVTTDVVVEPNDLETTITNIQAMVGLWTEQYLSALGQGSGGGGGGGDTLVDPLASINDAGLGAPTDANVVIAWDGVRWSYKPYVTGGGGGGGTLTSVGMSVPTGFKVSNGDSQTITTSGTFALSFGGSIAKNRVLASPSDAAGAPSWRKLVASDIPTLTASKISDISITNGTIIIGGSSVTPLVDATLKSNYSWWGQKLNDIGRVIGDLFMLSAEADAGLNSNSAKLKFNSYSVDSSDHVRRSPYIQALSGGYGGYGKKRLSVFQSNASDYTSEFNEVLSILPNGRVGIGTTSPEVLFDVNGYAKTTRLYLASDVYLEYDSSNSGVHLVGAGLYADTYLSAIGAGSGGGGGSASLTEPLASINEAGLGTPSANKVIVYTSNGWSYMPYTTGNGTVTSVNGAPASGSHLTVTGGAITTSGTLTVGVDSGYSIPTTAKQTNWDTAYTKATTLEGYFTNGVANSAAKLTTVSKTAWGQTYWTANGVPTNVSGTITVGNGDIILSNAHNINVVDNTATEREVLRMTSANNLLIGRGTASAEYNTYLYGNIIGFRYGNSGTTGMVLRNTGHLTVNASDITDTEQLVRNIYLNVGGAVKANRIYLFTHSSDSAKDVYLEYDSSNSGVHLVGAGLYADTYLSALGAGSGGGGGSASLTEPLASINEAGLGTPSANKVIVSTVNGWEYRPYNTGNGTVTSVNGAPASGSHLTVTGGAITTSGTLTVGVASGYAIPTAAKQTNWDAAYNNNHTHSNKSVLDDITIGKVSNWDSAYTKATTLEGYFDNGSAKTAKKLTSSVLLWGNSFDGSAGIGTASNARANLVYVGSISMNSTITGCEGVSTAKLGTLNDTWTDADNKERLWYGYDRTGGINIRHTTISDFYGMTFHTSQGWMCLTEAGNVGIGTTSPAVLLDVNGAMRTNKIYLYKPNSDDTGAVYLTYDSMNGGVHVYGAGLYTDTYLSALGAGSGGGSGSGITMNDVWSALAATAPNSSSQQINVTHMAQALSNYVTLNSRQTISGTKEFYNANIKSNFGAKFGSLRINFNTSELPADGEINRSSGSGVCIQYDNAYNVDLCHGGGSVKMQDTLSFSKSGTDHTMSAPAKLTVSAAQLYVSAAIFDGNVPYLGGSDIRLKDVINPVTASVEDIANVRIFDFRWKKDGENGKIHFGSAAQDWQPIFPHAVVADKEGFLSMDYAGIAVGAVKTVAQEVVLLKKRVTELEKQLKAS